MPIYDDNPEPDVQPQERIIVREISWRQQIAEAMKWCVIVPVMGLVVVVGIKLIGRLHDAVLALSG